MKNNKNPYIDSRGNKSWWFNGLLHREGDLPAMEYSDGYKEWWFNGQRHRENNLPSIEFGNGTKRWFLNGICYRCDFWIDYFI